jgi:A/G-specific adenine glycosylase
VKLTPTDKERLLKARRTLLGWFAKNGRSFFWRRKERDPYIVLVAELMLQQTQASRVDEFLPKFLDRFPTIKHLAKANTSDVIKMWQGLGYNRRALNLQKAAQQVTNEHKGLFPSDEKSLLALPGVGLYTARALQAFSFQKDVSVVDVNIERVISRITKKMKSPSDMLPMSDVHTINEAILPKGKSEQWHEALMDLGATICRKNPKCDICPLQKNCASYPTLSKQEVTATPKRSNEKQYFGSPKRIWRGRVLKHISLQEKTSAQEILNAIKSYSTESNEFEAFIDIVIYDLAKDGFITKSGRSISLR